jgi:hypothetical protein
MLKLYWRLIAALFYEHSANAALTPTRQHRVIAAPLLVSLRQQRERKYFFESACFILCGLASFYIY